MNGEISITNSQTLKNSYFICKFFVSQLFVLEPGSEIAFSRLHASLYVKSDIIQRVYLLAKGLVNLRS